jgi:hypothetical protein
LIRLLVIIILVYLVIRFFNRLAVSSYTYSNRRSPEEPQPTRKEGSVTLQKPEKPSKIIPKDEGEYVDFEEVK